MDTIKIANKINVIKDGIVVEEGNHVELMHNNNIYFKLQTQKSIKK